MARVREISIRPLMTSKTENSLLCDYLRSCAAVDLNAMAMYVVVLHVLHGGFEPRKLPVAATFVFVYAKETKEKTSE